MKRVTVLLADDHSIVVEGLRRVLEPKFDVIGVVGDGRSLVTVAKKLKPDVIIVDISMPLLNGIEATRQIRSTSNPARIVFLSVHPDVVYVSEALQAGGSAYVLKTYAGTEILTAIQAALKGQTYLSPAIDSRAVQAQIRRDERSHHAPGSLTRRQREVVQLVAEGRSTKEIADILRISPRTVEFHRQQVVELLGLHSIADMVQYAMKHRITSV